MGRRMPLKALYVSYGITRILMSMVCYRRDFRLLFASFDLLDELENFIHILRIKLVAQWWGNYSSAVYYN